MQLDAGIEQAGQAFHVPLVANWQRVTDPTSWFSTLTAEIDSERPVIVYLADGGILWNGSWHYGHYIVMSGYTRDRQIIYYDPWDGRGHRLSYEAFAQAWGTSSLHNPVWRYMHVMPAGDF